MKTTLALAVSLLLNIGFFKPIENHVKWGYTAKRISATEAIIYLRATLDDGWHIYSQHIEEGGPTKTEITFTPSKEYKLVGKTIEPATVAKFDRYFKMNIASFEKEVVFQQKVKLKSAGATSVKGKLEFMVCNDRKCLPPTEVEFVAPVPAK